MCFAFSKLNHLKSLRGSFFGLPPPLNAGMLRYLRICDWINLRKNVGDSRGLKFLQSSLPLWWIWISKVPWGKMLWQTQITQKVGSNRITLSMFSKYSTVINKNSKRYLLPDQTRFLGIIYLFGWAALPVSHLFECSESMASMLGLTNANASRSFLWYRLLYLQTEYPPCLFSFVSFLWDLSNVFGKSHDLVSHWDKGMFCWAFPSILQESECGGKTSGMAPMILSFGIHMLMSPLNIVWT